MSIKIIDVANNSNVVSHRNYSKGLSKTKVFRPTSNDIRINILAGAFYGVTGAKKYKYGDNTSWVKDVKKGEYLKLSRPNTNDRSTECNGTAFVVAVCRCAGVTSATIVGNYEGYMSNLCKSGHLKEQSFNANSVDKLKAGDILVRKDSQVGSDKQKGHAYIYVGNVKKSDVIRTVNESSSTDTDSSNQPRKYSGKLPDLVKNGRERISYLAIDMSYKLGTPSSKYRLGSGTRRPLYNKALHSVWTDRNRWKLQASREGASCDVGASTIIRYSEVDKSISHALSAQIPYLDKKSSIWQKTSLKSSKKMQPGDVGIYLRYGPGGHIWVCARKGVLAESSYTNKYFLRLTRGHTSAGGFKKYAIYRSKKPIPIELGDRGEQVVLLKKFLNWFGNYGLNIKSNECDSKTVNAIKNFQKKVGLKQSGKFGSKELKKAGGQVTTTGDGSDVSGSSYSSGSTVGVDSGGAILLDSIETLYSTDKYKWFDAEEQESEEQKKLKERQSLLKSFLSNISVDISSGSSIAPTDVQVGSIIKSSKEFKFKPRLFAGKEGTASLTSYPNLVEAPTIILNLNGITIGGYGNYGDKYPNYISSMTVQKINGRINKYTINLVHQIRPGEDPNFLDSLLSRTGYTNPLKIVYGDSSSPGMLFKEECAIITDVKSNDNVSSSSISYTIQALSSVILANQSYFNFKEVVSKPSTLVNKILYDSGPISTQLQDALPGMKDRSFVSSNNLIPNNDAVVTIGGMANVTPMSYIGHVVSCMTNDNNTSSYFLTYNDSINGAYFKISEVAQYTNTNVLYKVDVGYPGDNFVTNFQLCDNIYWPLVYEYNDKIPRWNYSIDDYGNVLSSKSNSLMSDNKYLNDSIINSNWWKSITEFPISAKLTLKGLTIPAMLMTYIRVNTLFYGQKDIASGIYVVTDQTDSISGNGYSTTLTLLRVGN